MRLTHAHAVFEQRSGRIEHARALFSEAASIEPQNSYVSHAWGLLEESTGNVSSDEALNQALDEALDEDLNELP